MAKLYWRVKKDGKWNWTPVRVTFRSKPMIEQLLIDYRNGLEEEE